MISALDDGADSAAVELDRTQCGQLLGTVGVGRVVLSVGCIPFAMPVNIGLLDGDVIFAADGGSKLTPSVYGQVVSVQADDIDPVSHEGWSVVVTGIAQPLTDLAKNDSAAPLLRTWAAGPDPLLVRVPSTLISGRRLAWGALASGDELDN
jgi:nitroimidazol reductase NimA-like FMN-containing flavoprotein (pyridoxamine 5'-phosphate oxidase superfamily)